MSLTWTPRIDRALQQCARAHDGQRRKSGGAPYVSHPVAVAMIVSGHTTDEDVIIAALLHDVLEDVSPTVYGAGDIEADFGPRVLELVHGVSEEKSADAPHAPWRVRKEGYLASLEQAPLDCVLISAADKTHNLHSLCTDLEQQGAEVWELFNASPEQTLWFQRAVADVVKRRLGQHPAARDLASLVDRLAGLA